MLYRRLIRPSSVLIGIWCVVQSRSQRAREFVDHAFGVFPSRLDLRAERLVRLRLEILERQLFELVLHLAHPEAIGDGSVDVECLLGDLDAALLGQVMQRPHVVEPIRQLHEDDADVIHHRQQHLAEVLGLPFLARRERDRADLGDTLDDVRDLLAEQLLDPLRSRERVLDDIVEQPGGDSDHVELHVGQRVRDLERVYEIRLTRMAHLALVFEGREHIGAPQKLQIGFRAIGAHLFEKGLESNHEERCLTSGTTPVGTA